MEALRIGHSAQQYPEQRNIIGKVSGAEYKLCRDYYSIAPRLLSLVSINGSPEWVADRPFRFRDFGLNRVDCLHFFNGVNYSQTPWVATFETFIPRFLKVLRNHSNHPEVLQSCSKTRKALECLASDYCLGLFALSNSALELQAQFLDIFPDRKDRILSKTQVLHPPQPVLSETAVASYPFELGGSLTFMLVGHQFFSKGGREILDALATVRKKNCIDIRLILVSELRTDQYVTMTDEKDVIRVKDFIDENAGWIEYYESLPRAEVLEKMQECDVGMLPSHAETYGYSVLEFQACARPVITTDVRAFPEINNNECGWVIAVPKRVIGGEAFYETVRQREVLSRTISDGIASVLEEILNSPDLIIRKGARAYERIRRDHSPEAYSARLTQVYEKALN